MSDSDWVVSVVIGGEVTTRLAKPAVVEPQHRGEREQALGDPDEHAGWGTPAVLLESELALEGVDDALDPLADAAQRPMPARLVSPVRSQHARAKLADVAFKVAAGEPLVGVDHGTGKPWRRGIGQQGLGDLALAELGRGQAQLSGIPSAVASRYSRSPQNQREWLAQ